MHPFLSAYLVQGRDGAGDNPTGLKLEGYNWTGDQSVSGLTHWDRHTHMLTSTLIANLELALLWTMGGRQSAHGEPQAKEITYKFHSERSQLVRGFWPSCFEETMPTIAPLCCLVRNSFISYIIFFTMHWYINSCNWQIAWNSIFPVGSLTLLAFLCRMES